MKSFRYAAGALAGLATFSLFGCTPTVNSQSRSDSPPARRQGAPQQGMSNRNKVLLLAGAAALYYLYQKNKDNRGHGPEGQYYRSKNGRVYYRDAKGRPVWVTPPAQLRVPASDYERYTGRSVDESDGAVIRQAPPGW